VVDQEVCGAGFQWAIKFSPRIRSAMPRLGFSGRGAEIASRKEAHGLKMAGRDRNYAILRNDLR
jgi:hypothetical protein